MSTPKVVDPAFQGAGQKVGIEIWRIEDFKPVALPKSDYGKFYSGDSYIVLQTTSPKGGAYLYDVHFWIGKDSSQDEAGTAAIKTVELDSVLGGRAVQYRELQGYESDKFLSYFKPCIIPMEGGFASGFKTPEEETFETRLYICKGKRAIRIKQVPFARSSLNHDDVFILDTENKIYQFNGANSNIQERAKSLEVIQHLKEKYHGGVCDVAIVDDGKLQAESDSGEFWVLFGGFAPIGKKTVSDDDVVLETTAPKLYSINGGELKFEDIPLTKAVLENTRCFLLDCGAEMFVWVGRVTQLEDRKAATKAVEEFIINQKRPKTTRVTQVIQGYESHAFKSKFESWPAGTATGNSGAEDGRGKVAALLKQQGVDVKGAPKSSTPVNEEVPPLLEGGGRLEVWCIDGNARSPLPKEDNGKFYSGDCYIVLYTYHSGDKKEEYYLNYWIGKESTADDQVMGAELANTMWNSLKGRPVLGRIYQGKEPPQFVALFQPMVILKGGISSGYKKITEEKGAASGTYSPEGIALLRVSGTAIHNNKTLHVDALATSLSSTDCFVLQTGSAMFTWHGNSSTYEQQQWAAKVAEFLKPGVTVKHCKEGTESSAFWFALDGKQSYTSKPIMQDTIVRDPHLYAFSIRKGRLEVTEIFNFCQDDLLTEDLMILDTHGEVFIWIGQCVEPKEKQKAFEVGQKYIEHAMSIEDLSPYVPLYKVSEGNEPCFFKTYFSWDNTKSVIHGNSFQKKLSLLFGLRSEGASRSSGNGGPTQRASALAALSSAFNPSSQPKQANDSRPPSSGDGPTQRASALAALSSSAFNPAPQQKQATDSRSPSSGDGPTQRASALAALSNAFNPSSKPKTPPPSRSGQGSQRAAAVAALSSVLTAEQSGSSENLRASKTSTTSEKTEAEVVVISPAEASPRSEAGESSEFQSEKDAAVHEVPPEVDVAQPAAPEVPEEQETEHVGEATFSYDRLISKSTDPIRGIDYKRREAYLSESEFQTVFGITKDAFYLQPGWKQELQKRKADLF
ncbi:villin-2-like [Triticum urartu]|uniref:HP domain-containing protein n=1 Tax=Triticum urartu TaxID=4572 RepID=A0A8R7PXK4_TRIUA|nr:villin-2-like [Triticum dicoccoides]XP_048566205.1 villin-2-like [Triticum urartu]